MSLGRRSELRIVCILSLTVASENQEPLGVLIQELGHERLFLPNKLLVGHHLLHECIVGVAPPCYSRWFATKKASLDITPAILWYIGTRNIKEEQRIASL